MKNYGLALALAIFMVLPSCQKTEGEGTVSFTLEEGVVAEMTKALVSDYAPLPAAGAFKLEVKNTTSNKVVYDGTVGDWSAETKLAPGDYSANVSYGQEEEEGIRKPYFVGTGKFRVQAGANTEVAIKVSLGNCLVKVECTEAFRNYYPESSFVVSTPLNPAGFEYGVMAVFISYQFTVSGTVTSQSGVSASLEPKSWRGDPATCYTVKYDVSNVGGVTVSISFDDAVDTVEVEEIDLNS